MTPHIMTLSAYETTAEAFFESLKAAKVDLLLDVRLRNTNQLCGFTKERDLAYFTHTIVGAAYAHELELAPPDELLAPYLHHDIDFDEYASGYRATIESRGSMALFSSTYASYDSIAILGTATKKRKSHAEVLAQMVASYFDQQPGSEHA